MTLTNYSWRSDIERIEIVSDTQFIEITKGGCRTVFTITKQEPYYIWEFDMENKNMKGHWVGIFGGNEKGATIDFTEYIEPKEWFMTPFVKMYLKYWLSEVAISPLRWEPKDHCGKKYMPSMVTSHNISYSKNLLHKTK